MRFGIAAIIVVLLCALAVCARFARASSKPMAHDVFVLLVCLMPPMLGNLLIIASTDWLVAQIGCYLYYLGMDAAVLALLKFTVDYCNISRHWRPLFTALSILVDLDAIQLLLNPVFGHAFYTTPIMVYGAPYHAMTPLAGQTVHRIIAYGIFLISLVIFSWKTFSAARTDIERYAVILTSIIICGLWQTFYIFSRSPIDRSMIGFGVFGLLTYFFALHYRPYRLLDRMLSQAVSDMAEVALFYDPEDKCIYANAAAEKRFGITEGEGLDRGTAILHNFEREFDAGTDHEWNRQATVTDEKGKERYWNLYFQPIFDNRGRKEGSLLSIWDRSEEERQLRRERYAASHDRLTSLYNQERLFEATRELIDSHPDERIYVVMADVREFKLVNDIYGRETGDEVLCSLAQGIHSHASANMVYGRISGDRFGYALPASEFPESVVIEATSTHDFSTFGINFPLVVHTGVYDVTERDLPISVMYDRAYMAIASIKNDFQRRLAYYDETMREDALWQQKISGELRYAIRSGQIRPYLQPMVNGAGEVEGAEVLVRWIHPEEGFLSPARFIPCFEENGMIALLDQYMWECSCRILKDWQRRGIDLFLSVNISPKDFYFLDVVQVINDLVQKYEIDPSKLRLEITETIMMSDAENRLRVVESLRSHGHLVEMDDFGSGYSSLNMLKDMPVDVLKIDMMFLYQTKDQIKARTILQTIINLSNSLGIPSITEGVETADQRDMLVNMGCRLFQGYFFAKPMPEEDFEAIYLAA